MTRKFRWNFAEKLKLLILDGVIYFALTAGLFLALVPNANIQDFIASPALWFISFNVLVWNYIFGNYEIAVVGNFRKTLQSALFVVVCTLLIVTLVNYLGGKQRTGVFGRGVLAGSLVGFWIYLHVSRGLLAQVWKSLHQDYRWIFIGDEPTKRRVMQDMQQIQSPVAIDWMTQVGESQLLDESSSLLGVVFSVKEKDPDLIEILMKVRLKGLAVFDLIDFYENYFKKIPVFYLSSEFFSFSKGFNLLGNPFLQRLKRLSDIGIAILVLIPALPLMALTAFLIRLESKGGALYSQKRSGKDGRVFTLYKFRSMRADAEAKGVQWAKVNDSRVTVLGKFLRKTRIDELPQLWNILKGDMSFVGPRPERPEFNQELEKNIPFYQLRHLVRPGLTGWAQIHYPYGASLEDAFQKLQYDLYYVKNFSLLLDLQVILKTVRVVILGQGR